VETFKLSNDPRFVEKVRDFVGLYVNPPEHALVVSVDEKSQIQALDRTQPGLPMKRGRGATMTHDYKRHGTTTLFAALDVKAGTLPDHASKLQGRVAFAWRSSRQLQHDIRSQSLRPWAKCGGDSSCARTPSCGQTAVTT
jgi:hypothetical protein